jgi:DNA-directed RNA polymerase subunit F
MHKILTPREKIILSTTIGVIIFSVLFHFIIVPILKRVEAVNNRVFALKIKLTKYTWLLSQKETIQNKFEQSVSTLNLDRTNTLVNALSNIETIAKNANIRIIDIRPQASRKVRTHREVIIELKAQGASENYIKFLYDIENSLLLLRIKSLKLNAKPNTPNLEGNFLISQIVLE